jgi:hypothetical protein
MIAIDKFLFYSFINKLQCSNNQVNRLLEVSYLKLRNWQKLSGSVIAMVFLGLFSSAQAQIIDTNKPHDDNAQAINVKEKSAMISTDSLKNVFYQNASIAKLQEKKISALLKIIDQRNRTITRYHSKRNQHSPAFAVQHPELMYDYKIEQLQKFYAKKISTLLSYNEYCVFVAKDYKTDAEENTKFEFSQLVESYPDLTSEQKAKLFKILFDYHLNLILISNYYYFDTSLQKSKNGVLTFQFEKKLEETCKELKIKIDKLKDIKSSIYQWN